MSMETTMKDNKINFQLKSSDKKEVYDNGSWRDDRTGKGRYDLIPFRSLMRVAKWYEMGAKKYGDNNWRKGQPLNRYFDSAMRHLIKWQLGWKDEDHLAAAVWNVFAIIEHQELINEGVLPLELDDRFRQVFNDPSIEVPLTK